MTITEIRTKALPRCKTKGMSLCAMTASTLKACAIFAMFLTSFSIEATLIFALLLIMCGGGLSRSAMGAWRRGESPFSSLFYFFTSVGRFANALVISALISALAHISLTLVMDATHLYSMASRVGCGLGAAACALVAHVISLAYFALDLHPSENCLRAIGRVIMFVKKDFMRLITLDAAVLWWCAAFLAAVAVLSALFATTVFMTLTLTFAAYLSLCWLVSPYYRLTLAGLAKDSEL